MDEGELQMVVGENLRRVRHAMGHSQESFGEHVGWHRTFVGSVERGERNLTLRTIERIAIQLEVDPLLLILGPELATKVGRRKERLLRAADRPGGGPPTSEGERHRARPNPS